MAPFKAIAALLAAVNQINPIAFSGPGQYEKGHEYKDSTPVSEKRVLFDLWYPNEGEAPRWELSTRLDAVPVPDSLIPNAQRLNTVYDFNIPGGQNLTEAVAANSAKLDDQNFCVTILETELPAAEAKRYNEKKEKDFGCTRVFQEPCMRILERLARDTTPGPDGCRFSQVDFSKIKQCEYIFGDTQWSDKAKLSTYNLLKPGLDLSGGFAHITSDVYDGSNAALASSAEHRIHSVMIESGETFTPLCVRMRGPDELRQKESMQLEDDAVQDDEAPKEIPERGGNETDSNTGDLPDLRIASSKDAAGGPLGGQNPKWCCPPLFQWLNPLCWSQPTCDPRLLPPGTAQ